MQAGRWWPKDAYVEYFQNVVSPVSLYLGQLEERLGYLPAWVNNTIDDFRVFRNAVINGNSYLPDTALEFSRHFTRRILENKPIGTNIGSVVVATNGIVDNTITYSLNNSVSNFEIDENSGQLTSAIIFDYESKDSYILVVNASDSYGNTASVTLTIHIGDVYEFSIATKTQQVQDAIVDAISGVNNVADVTEDHLEAILYLDLNDKGITTLKSNDFEGLTSLQHLDLSNNKFRTLPDDIFSGLTLLQHLDLSDNNLRPLPDDIFSGLTSLEHLTLSNNNKLKTLSDDIFSGLTSLKTIGLHTINLESLSGDVFAGLSSLTHIYLNNNNLESLDGDLFSGLTSLTLLQLDNNLLESLPSGIFKGLTSLEYLWLQGNNVDPLPLIVSLEIIGKKYVKAVIATGAPFDIVLPVNVTNGSIKGGHTTITISAGETESDEDDLLEIVRNNNTTGAGSIDIGVLPSLPDRHDGYKLSKSADLPLLVFNALVGAPTQINTPDITLLHNNFPNPFNPDTWIPFQLSKESNVSLTIYDIRGVVVREINLGIKAPGYYLNKSQAIHWDGKNASGESTVSGVYFYNLKTDNMSSLKKMILLK